MIVEHYGSLMCRHGINRAACFKCTGKILQEAPVMKNNDVWIAAAYDNLRQSIEENAFNLAQAVIDDAKEHGFRHDAQTMQKELDQAIQNEEREML